MQQRPESDHAIAAIVLAAGSSSRMGGGRHKLLLPLGEQPVIRHVIDTIQRSQARPIIVVVGHQADSVRAALAPTPVNSHVVIIENPSYLQGMSTSIHIGLRTLMNMEQPVQGALIMLGDQPLMTSRVIDTLIETHAETEKRIIAPLYADQRGNPVLFDASLFPELLAVSGDEGGRSVLQRHREEVASVEVGDATTSFDVDTWEAYQQVVDEWQRQQER